MASSAIGYYLVPNATGKTTGSFIHVIPSGTANFNDVIEDLTGSIAVTDQRARVIWTETIRVAISHALLGYTVDLGAFRMRLRIPGSMTCEDQSFDGATDEIVIELYCDDELSDVFEDVIPYRVSAEDLTDSIKVSNIMDVTTQRFATVIGTTSFAVLGNGITLDGEDEYVKAYNKKTGVLIGTAVIDSVKSGQRAYCHFATSLPNGETTLEIATHGLAGETALRKFTKNVTAVYVEPEPIAKTSDGTVAVQTFTDNGQTATFEDGHEWAATGKGFTATQTAGVFFLNSAKIRLTPDAETTYGCTFTVASDKSLKLERDIGETVPPGTYPNARVELEFIKGETDEILPLPMNYHVL